MGLMAEDEQQSDGACPFRPSSFIAIATWITAAFAFVVFWKWALRPVMTNTYPRHHRGPAPARAPAVRDM
jgi:hypothetical protein